MGVTIRPQPVIPRRIWCKARSSASSQEARIIAARGRGIHVSYIPPSLEHKHPIINNGSIRNSQDRVSQTTPPGRVSGAPADALPPVYRTHPGKVDRPPFLRRDITHQSIVLPVARRDDRLGRGPVSALGTDFRICDGARSTRAGLFYRCRTSPAGYN